MSAIEGFGLSVTARSAGAMKTGPSAVSPWASRPVTLYEAIESIRFGTIIGDDYTPPFRAMVLGRDMTQPEGSLLVWNAVILTDGDHAWGTWPQGTIVGFRADAMNIFYYGDVDRSGSAATLRTSTVTAMEAR